MLLRGKRGFAYFIEIILVIALALLIFLNVPVPGQGPTDYKQAEDLREIAWHSLNNLAEFNVLNQTLSNANFTEINIYLQEEVPETADYILEFYNESGCYFAGRNELRSAATYCGSVNATTNKDIVGVIYTLGNYYHPESLKLYLWRKL